MIEGITVLSQTEIIETNIASWFNSAFCIGLLLMAAITIWVVLKQKCYDKALFALVVFAILSTAYSVCLLSMAVSRPQPYRFRYEVTIEESVEIGDILEKYDIIEQRGNTLILEDKEKDESNGD